VGTKAPIRCVSAQYRRIAIIKILVVLGAASMYYLTTAICDFSSGSLTNCKAGAAKALIWGSLVATISPIIEAMLSEMYDGARLSSAPAFSDSHFRILGLSSPCEGDRCSGHHIYAALLILVGNAAMRRCSSSSRAFSRLLSAHGTRVLLELRFRHRDL